MYVLSLHVGFVNIAINLVCEVLFAHMHIEMRDSDYVIQLKVHWATSGGDLAKCTVVIAMCVGSVDVIDFLHEQVFV